MDTKLYNKIVNLGYNNDRLLLLLFVWNNLSFIESRQTFYGIRTQFM